MFFFQLPQIPEWAISRKGFNSIYRKFRDSVVTKRSFSDADIERYKEAIRQPGALTGGINYYRANFRRLFFSGHRDNDAVVSGRVSVPSLFIFGERDFAIIPRSARGIERYVSGPYREVRIPASGHWVQNEAVDEVNSVL